MNSMLGFEIIIDHLFKRIMAMAKAKNVPGRFNDAETYLPSAIEGPLQVNLGTFMLWTWVLS